MVSGNGVIHGLTEVLSIVQNRCDETKYLKFRVMSSGRRNLRLRTSDSEPQTDPQTEQQTEPHPVLDQGPTLFLHRVPVWTACSSRVNCARTTPFQT